MSLENKFKAVALKLKYDQQMAKASQFRSRRTS